MSKLITTEIFVSHAKKIHGDKYDYSKTIYVKGHTKCKIDCPIHGEFLQTPSNHTHFGSPRGCPSCAREDRINKRRLPKNEFILRANKVHKNKYDYSQINYISAKHKIDVVCPLHGKFTQTPSKHLRGDSCPLCGNEKRAKSRTYTKEKFLKKCKKAHGNTYDYSETKYEKEATKVKIICKKHGTFYQTPHAHFRGAGCQKCGIEFNVDLHTLTQKEFLKKVRAVHKNTYDYSETVYEKARLKVCIICKKHGKFYQTANSHMNGKGCCKCTGSISKPEIEFLDLLKIPSKNRQSRIGRFRVDGLVPRKNTIYEFLGDWWHGNPKIFKREEIHPSIQVKYGELFDKTFKRFDKLVQMGYSIRYIWENDWKQWKSGKTKKLLIETYE